MTIARFGEDSELYIWNIGPTIRNRDWLYLCDGCGLEGVLYGPQLVEIYGEEDLKKHLLAHIEAGHRVDTDLSAWAQSSVNRKSWNRRYGSRGHICKRARRPRRNRHAGPIWAFAPRTGACPTGR